MRHFIKKCLSFFIFLLLLLTFSVVFLSFHHSNVSKDYNLDKTTKAIFIGDSHVRSSLNDYLIDGHVNMGLFAESYYFSYYKLKLLFNKNPQIKKLYLGMGYHNLSSYFNDYIFGSYSKDISSNYFFILPVKQKLKFIRLNLWELSSYMKLNFKKEFHYLIDKNKSSNKIGFVNNSIDTVSITSINRRIQAQFYTQGIVKGFSKINLDYLKKINGLCQQNQVELIFFNTPLHPYYKKQVPKEYLKKHEALIRQYGYKFIDFSDMILAEDCFRKDGDHLTKKGALLITQYFNDYLNQSTITK